MSALRDALAWDLGTDTDEVPVAGARRTNYPAADVVLARLRAMPLTDVLDTLNLPYSRGWTFADNGYSGGGAICDDRSWDPGSKPCLIIVDNPATDEARDA